VKEQQSAFRGSIAHPALRALGTTLVVAAFFASCQTAPSPPPAPAPAPSPAAPVEAKPIGMVKVTASALNLRNEASSNADVIAQVKRGERLTLLEAGESWMKVRLASGQTGWAAARFLEREGEKAAPRKKGSCLPDSDFAFATTPMPNLSDSRHHGLVVVDATVDTKGNVISTKVIQNSTGDEALAFLTEREIKSAKFIAPVRSCVPKTFIFKYRRTF
jgi:uncharacterized protein YgiM (DUF1202 family)